MQEDSFLVKIEQKQKIGDSIDVMVFEGQATFAESKMMISLLSPTGYQPYVQVNEISSDTITLYFYEKHINMRLKIDCPIVYDYPFGDSYLQLTVVLKDKKIDQRKVEISYHFMQEDFCIENTLRVEAI